MLTLFMVLIKWKPLTGISLLRIIFRFILVNECFACMLYMCTVYMPGARRERSEVLDPVEPEMSVRTHVGAGNQTRVLCKSNKCS